MNGEFFRFNGEQPPSTRIKNQNSQEEMQRLAQSVHDGEKIKPKAKVVKIGTTPEAKARKIAAISRSANERKKKQAAKRRAEREAKK